MAIHWKVQFRSLRANRLYTVNIYDDNYTGNPVSLIGAANPFETQEDDDDDMFKPVRTQSGYLKIVDTGDINWRDIIPTTDTDRPVTLTHEENNATVVDWIGFMQAQNFGARLYEVPIERDFPLQCPLSVLSRNDISTTNKDIQNFAWLLWSALNTIPSIARPTQIIVQGGADAIEWLLKRVDWFDFIDADKNHQPKAKYDYGSAIEDMCRFWGLTARIHGQTLYMTCADDAGESNALVMAYADLANLASGNYTPPSGIVVGDDDITIETMFTTVTIGDIFASIDNNDYQNRGPNKAVVKVDSNGADDDVIAPFDAELVKEMNRADWYEGTIINEDDDYWHYSKDVISVDRVDLDGYSVAQIPSLQDQERYYATFNLLSKYNGVDAGGGYSDVGNVIRFKRTYNGNVFMTLETKYEHCFANGFFRIFADTYRKGGKYENGNFFAGNPSMIMALGIGNSRSTAKWWNGQAWQSSATTFQASIGNKKPELFTRVESGYTLVYESSIIETTSTMCGRMFIDLLGTNDSRVEDDADGRKTFDLKDFHIEFSKNDNVTKQQYPNSGWYDVKDNLDEPELEYEAKSTSMVKEDYNVDSPYGGNDGIPPGYGILMNGDGSRMSTVPYNGDTERPEQHLVDRVVNYWSTSKRRIECELLTHNGSAATVAAGISPRNKLSIDGSTMHPIAISRAWADDVVIIGMMEVADVIEVINFEDNVVKNLCVTNWGGNVVPGEITPGEAAAVTTLNDVFKANTSITKFNELRYFTGLTSLYSSGTGDSIQGQFHNCTALAEITLPAAPITDFRGAFRYTAIVDLDLSPITATSYRIDSFVQGGSSGTTALRTVKLPGGSCTNVTRAFKRARGVTTLIIDGTLDLSQCTSFSSFFDTTNALTTITGAITGVNYNINLASCPLTVDAALIILNGLSSGSSSKCTFKSSMKSTYEASADFNAAVTRVTGYGWEVVYS